MGRERGGAVSEGVSRQESGIKQDGRNPLPQNLDVTTQVLFILAAWALDLTPSA
jgi:hypothetical protein